MKLSKFKFPLLTFLTFLLTTTAQATMGTRCWVLINQPKVPKCLLKSEE